MTKFKGLGTKLQVQISSTFTDVAQRVSLKGPDIKMGETKITELDSTREEFGPTLPDLGEIGGTLWFDPGNTVHAKLRADAATGLESHFKFIYPDNFAVHANTPFTGFLKKWTETGMESDGYLQAEFSIRVTSDMPLVPGAAS